MQPLERIRAWLEGDTRAVSMIGLLVERLPRDNSIFIVGGALRDCLFTPPRLPKDLDLVVAGVPVSELQNITGARQNYFGGLMLSWRGLAVDLWPLEDTYHIKQFGLPATIESFLDGAPFNLDKIAYDVRTATLHDFGCSAGVTSQRIIYRPAHPYLEPIQAVRCLLLQKRTGFELDDSAQQLMHRIAGALAHDDEARRHIVEFLRFTSDPDAAGVIEEIAAWNHRKANLS